MTTTESGNFKLIKGTSQEVLDELASMTEQYQIISFNFDTTATCFALVRVLE